MGTEEDASIVEEELAAPAIMDRSGVMSTILRRCSEKEKGAQVAEPSHVSLNIYSWLFFENLKYIPQVS